MDWQLRSGWALERGEARRRSPEPGQQTRLAKHSAGRKIAVLDPILAAEPTAFGSEYDGCLFPLFLFSQMNETAEGLRREEKITKAAEPRSFDRSPSAFLNRFLCASGCNLLRDSHFPNSGAEDRSRTDDLLITNHWFLFSRPWFLPQKLKIGKRLHQISRSDYR